MQYQQQLNHPIRIDFRCEIDNVADSVASMIYQSQIDEPENEAKQFQQF